MRRIVRLSNQVANQIAAGEVIERPASVLKECIENSLDAFATSINIQLFDNQLCDFQITDNGQGIPKADLALALQCHATSKITDFDDLLQIQSFGFRGEALASLAAVSRLTLTYCHDIEQGGWCVTVDGPSQVPVCRPAAHEIGTTVTVEGLFSHVPARRKFLKSMKTEMFHVEDVIRRFALAYPQVAFTVTKAKKTWYHLPEASTQQNMRQRLGRCFGQAWAKHALYLKKQATDIEATLWVLPHEHATRHAQCQYLYINNRIIKDPKLSHFIRQQFARELAQGLAPGYVMQVNLPADQLDVNAHPTKQQIRFHQPQWVMHFLQSVLSEAQTQLSLRAHSAVQLPKREPVSAPLMDKEYRRSTPSQIEGSETVLSHRADPFFLWKQSEQCHCFNLPQITQHWWQTQILEPQVQQKWISRYLLPLSPAIQLTQEHQAQLTRLGFYFNETGDCLYQPFLLPKLSSEAFCTRIIALSKAPLSQWVSSFSECLVVSHIYKLTHTQQDEFFSELAKLQHPANIDLTPQHLAILFE